MYFLSASVSLVTPLTACQFRAMRNTRMYSDNTVLRVKAVIKAGKQQLPSQERELFRKDNDITNPVHTLLSVYNDQIDFCLQGRGHYNKDYTKLSHFN